MSITASLGYPRIGRNRELKFALERYWAGKSTAEDLLRSAREIRQLNWQVQKEGGIQLVPCNDFSLYDHVLDTTWMVGAIPERFSELKSCLTDLDLYFAMARGWQKENTQVAAMEMTKWFDTNYHYIVPEIAANQRFCLNDSKILEEWKETRAIGINARPVLLGPVSYLLLSKPTSPGFLPLMVLDRLIEIYAELFGHLAEAGVEWVQMDEPCLVQDLAMEVVDAYRKAYTALSKVRHPRILLTTYFGRLDSNLSLAQELPVDGLHVDLVQAPGQLDEVLATCPAGRILSLGLVSGRNVWRTDLSAAVSMVDKAVEKLGRERLVVAPACSLMFCPQDLELETELDIDVKSWLAFARQKLTEVSILGMAANGEVDAIRPALVKNRRILESRKQSAKVTNPTVQEAVKKITEKDHYRHNSYIRRKIIQKNELNLPVFPTTTIGSFPQTLEVRQKRSKFNRGIIDKSEYETYLREEIFKAIRLQENIGLDVLVHGEFERTDMVEYFAQQLEGFAFTLHGWVQSYGSRAVRPPILFGDISRPKPMTVEWSKYAQSLTDKPVKGMLTGPVTILQWSFIRDDQPRQKTCRQLAIALRAEVADLEKAGIKIIQVDEPALREGLPLRVADRADYLRWAVDCFRLVVGGAASETQIHTHMCYCEFGDFMEAIIRMDADVISIEASRSNMELLDKFRELSYPNDIGPGVYDIHSPRVPDQKEIESLLRKALTVIPVDRLWVNPDCGLKTRGWDEVIPALTNMVAAAQKMRIGL